MKGLALLLFLVTTCAAVGYFAFHLLIQVIS